MSDQDPVALARRLAEQAKQRAASAAAAPAPAPGKSSLLSRAPKPLSPQEALQKAIAEEAKREAAKDAEDANRRAAVEQARQLAEQARRTAPARAEHTLPPVAPVAARPAAPKVSIEALVGQRLPGFEIASTHPVASAEAFKGVWTSHRVRAALDEDYGLLVTADLLLDAVARVNPGALVGLRVEREGAAWALFVDGERGVLLAILPRPEIYLAGL